VSCIVLDCSAINFVDSQGVAQLDELATLTEEEGVTLRLARLKAAVRATLERGGVIPRIPESRIHASVDDAVQAELDESPE
jgi:SulP family sulfate permease